MSMSQCPCHNVHVTISMSQCPRHNIHVTMSTSQCPCHHACVSIAMSQHPCHNSHVTNIHVTNIHVTASMSQCVCHIPAAVQLFSTYIKRAILRHDHSAVISLFPVLKHLRAIKPKFDITLEVSAMSRSECNV